MREIKFRAWSDRANLMFYDIVGAVGENPIQPDGTGYYHSLEAMEIMQYTGLHDKNGKEIYEGDIVTHPLCVKEPHDVDEPCETFWGRIVFEVDRGQYFAINTKRNGYVIVMEEAYKFEVIGTIYENPELLEVK